MITLKEIVELSSLHFSLGNPELLKMLMLKNDNEFIRFRGRMQFDKKVRVIYPDINIFDLYEDFITNIRICNAIKYYCRDYYDHGDRMSYRFRHVSETGDGADTSIDYRFKVLDGITRPISDAFWNTYMPPNFVGDCSYLQMTYREEITPIPDTLPSVDSRFVYDLDAFRTRTGYNSSAIDDTTSGTADISIDTSKILLEAFVEYFKSEGK